MPLTVTVTPGHNFPADIPVSLEALRSGAQPSVTIAGAVGSGDLAAGAVTPAKSTPGAYWYAAATFANPAFNVTLDPALAGLANGVEVWIKTPAGGTNTTSSTLNVNALGAKKIYKLNSELLVAGDMRENTVYGFRYNTTLDSSAGGWQLFTPVGNGHRFATSTGAIGSPDAYAVTYSPTVTALTGIQGVPVYFKANFTNDGAANLAVDGLTAKSIRKHGDLPLEGGEIRANQIVCVVYDSALNSASGGFMLLSHVNQPVVTGSSRNLRVRLNATNPTYQIDVDADEVIVRSADHDHLRISSVNKTVDITATGVLGRTTTNESSDTKYHLWLIAQADGTNSAVLASSATLATAMADPSWPANYTYGALVGAVYNDGSSNFAQYWEYGNRWRFVSQEVTPTVQALAIDVAHDFLVTPLMVTGYLKVVNTNAAHGYPAGDIINVLSTMNVGGGPNVHVGANATKVFLLNSTETYIFKKDATTLVQINGGGPVYADFRYFVVAEL